MRSADLVAWPVEERVANPTPDFAGIEGPLHPV